MSHEVMEYDVVIVGAGPAGLAAAIHIRQLNLSLSVCVLEKAARLGGHILSGAILEPSALDELLPDWKDSSPPAYTPVTDEAFCFATAHRLVKLPLLKTLNNKGNVMISLGEYCRWLGTQADALGVDIFPGFAAADILYDETGSVSGVATGEMGVNKKGERTTQYQAPVQIRAKQTLIAEGCRGFLTQKLIRAYHLDADTQPQTYGLGLKELWEVDPDVHQPGKVMHTVGWPLKSDTYGGTFLYHLDRSRIAVGIVVGLDYKNPYTDPFNALQRFKTHPAIEHLFKNGRRLEYGARALNEGGVQAIPKLTFPGGMLIGCSAGLVNVGEIKGIHNAIRSGMLAAATVCASQDKEIFSYEKRLRSSPIAKELQAVRNIRPGFYRGLLPGLLTAGIDQILFRGRAPWTLTLHADHTATQPATHFKPEEKCKPDGTLTFDKLSSVFLTNTDHKEDQPCHLVLDNKEETNARFAGLEQFYCPAAVYEYIEKNSTNVLHINAANCIHCKACDIKDPTQNIHWTPPEGGGGPDYESM